MDLCTVFKIQRNTDICCYNSVTASPYEKATREETSLTPQSYGLYAISFKALVREVPELKEVNLQVM